MFCILQCPPQLIKHSAFSAYVCIMGTFGDYLGCPGIKSVELPSVTSRVIQSSAPLCQLSDLVPDAASLAHRLQEVLAEKEYYALIYLTKN